MRNFIGKVVIAMVQKRMRPALFRTFLQGILLAIVLVLSCPSDVSASGGNTGSEAENVAVSMYDVSTALTAFANNVVGSNTNDKHNTHELLEFAHNGVQIGDAGAILGYGDPDKGFFGYISSSTSQAATSTDYDALLSLGDNGKAYGYARYGRLLTDLGLDDTAPSGTKDAFRTVFGMFMRAIFALSAFVPQIFSLVLGILAFLNPFRFFIGSGSDLFQTTVAGTGDIKDQIIVGGMHQANTATNRSAFGALVNNTLGNEGVGGVATAAVDNITSLLTEIYNIAQNFGIYCVIPLLVVFLLWQVLVTGQSRFNRTSNVSRALSVAKRIALMIIAVPFCGMLYTSTIENLHDAVAYKSTSSQMAACTFVDFQSWVDASRLAVPSGSTLVSVGKGDGDGESVTAAGSANNATVRGLRDTVLNINYHSGILSSSSSLGLSGSTNYDVTSGIVDTSTGELKSDTMSKQEKQRLGSMLDRYSNGNFYQAAAFETGVNGQISKKFKNYLGSTPGTSNAGSNNHTVHEMYDMTNEVSDWMDREISTGTDNNVKILTGGVWNTSPRNFNIFSNGSQNAEPVASSSRVVPTDNMTFTYTGVAGSLGGLDPSKPGGLSSVSMYNYLSTKFDDTSLMTYSAERSTSEYTREAHYAVNLIGSGSLRVAYALNCVASLAVFVLIGFIYGFGMLVGNIKRGLKLMLTIPMAAAGLFKSMVQLVVYTVVMIAELMVTVFVYQIASELVMLIATITESAVTKAANQATILVGGLPGSIGITNAGSVLFESRMAFLFGIVILAAVVVAMGVGLYRVHRLVLAVHAFVFEWIYCHVGFVEFRQQAADVFAGKSVLETLLPERSEKGVMVCC